MYSTLGSSSAAIKGSNAAVIVAVELGLTINILKGIITCCVHFEFEFQRVGCSRAQKLIVLVLNDKY